MTRSLDAYHALEAGQAKLLHHADDNAFQFTEVVVHRNHAQRTKRGLASLYSFHDLILNPVAFVLAHKLRIRQRKGRRQTRAQSPGAKG